MPKAELKFSEYIVSLSLAMPMNYVKNNQNGKFS